MIGTNNLESKNIIVTFVLRDIKYRGELSPVFGGGGNTWHLYVQKYYWGQLMLTNNGWEMHTQNDKDLEQLADYFSQVLISWYQ